MNGPAQLMIAAAPDSAPWSTAFMARAMFSPEESLRGPGAAFVFLYYVIQVAWNLTAALIGLAMDPRSAPDGAAGATIESALEEAESASEAR